MHLSIAVSALGSDKPWLHHELPVDTGCRCAISAAASGAECLLCNSWFGARRLCRSSLFLRAQTGCAAEERGAVTGKSTAGRWRSDGAGCLQRTETRSAKQCVLAGTSHILASFCPPLPLSCNRQVPSLLSDRFSPGIAGGTRNHATGSAPLTYHPSSRTATTMPPCGGRSARSARLASPDSPARAVTTVSSYSISLLQ